MSDFDISLPPELETTLAVISDAPFPKIWDPVDFDSERYRAAGKLCKAFCDDQFWKSNISDRTVLEDSQGLLERARNLTETFAQQWANAKDAHNTKNLLELVKTALEKWSTFMVLLSTRSLCQLACDPGTPSPKFMQGVNFNLWHLHLYRNHLHMEENLPGVRKPSLSLIRFMAGKHGINPRQGGQAGDNRDDTASQSRQTAARAPQVRKTRPGQNEFARKLKDAYKCERYAKPFTKRWCPVTKDWLPADHTRAAHIVPHSLGDDLAEELFGRGTSLMDFRNGLYLHKDVEEAFDNAQVVILHNHNQSPPGQILTAYVVDQALRNKSYGEGEYEWKDVHDKELQFLPDAPARLALRYLYFHMLFAVVRLSIHQPPNWMNSIPELSEYEMLPTNGDYIQEGMLGNIIRVIGNPKVEEMLKNYIPQESPLQLDNHFPRIHTGFS